SPDTFNATSHDAMAMVIVTLEAFAGMWINAFIVSVLCIARVQRKSFNSNEKILLFLGCCRFGDLCSAWLYTFLSLLYPWCFYVHPVPQLFSALSSFLNASNVCVSACLCVFYCIKITNFRHTFFIYLKVKVDRMVPWLLLGSVLLSLLMSTLAYSIVDGSVSTNLNSTTPNNFWKLHVRMDGQLLTLFAISGFIQSTAFVAVIFSAFLLLISLWRHKHKMQTNSVNTLTMDAHIKAIKSILCFFIIYSINFTGFIMSLVYATKEEILPRLVTLVFQCALSVAHSLILIFSNPKLKKTLLRTLSCPKCKAC
ncbi:TA2R9 protein, partial [Halcyon senegalensis]|nr:TA2R9 protein [Halcyon senegalensis]